MTIPWMMNCAHTGDGWCLACVKELGEEAARLRKTVAKLPKCWRLNDEGKLVLDEPVTQGMTVWGICPVCHKPLPIGIPTMPRLLNTKCGGGHRAFTTDMCYGTKDAAEHATITNNLVK